LKHAQELAEQVKITSKRDKAGTVEMQEQVRASYGLSAGPMGFTTTLRKLGQYNSKLLSVRLCAPDQYAT
jgi:hypothetical protein